MTPQAALVALALALPGGPASPLDQATYQVSHEQCPGYSYYACAFYGTTPTTIHIPQTAPLSVWVHELAHVVDFLYMTPRARAAAIPLLYGYPHPRVREPLPDMELPDRPGWDTPPPGYPADPTPVERFADLVARCARLPASYPYRRGARLPSPTPRRCALLASLPGTP